MAIARPIELLAYKKLPSGPQTIFSPPVARTNIAPFKPTNPIERAITRNSSSNLDLSFINDIVRKTISKIFETNISWATDLSGYMANKLENTNMAHRHSNKIDSLVGGNLFASLENKYPAIVAMATICENGRVLAKPQV